MEEITKASAAEWEVLRVIWSLDEPTSRSVSTILEETQDWKVATTKTLLGRLVKKGYLTTTKKGNHFVYTPTLTEQESVSQRVSRLFDSICQAEVGTAIAQVIEDFQLSVDDQTRIQNALEKKSFVEELSCDCLSKGDGVCHCQGSGCSCQKNI